MEIKDIERKAEEVLEAFGKRTLPIAIEEVATHFGLRIGKGPSEEFSGLLLRKDDSALIGINDNESPQRQRFTIAHEIGHYLLHPAKEAFVDYRNSSIPRTPKEREADAFAAALLMPKKEIVRDYTAAMKGMAFDEGHFEKVVTLLANNYDVSEEAMKIRLMTLGTSS